jgi:hypothetical protein
MDRIASRVIEYYAGHEPAGSQIMHTQSVAHLTRLIAQGEGMTGRICQLQEIAAWLHDIGCPAARQKYGSSKPVYQEQEGKRLVHEWLDADPDFTSEEVDWLADVVGGHHRWREASRLGFQPLYEADLIVNLLEGYYAPELAQRFVKSGAVSTHTGKRLFQTLFFIPT